MKKQFQTLLLLAGLSFSATAQTISPDYPVLKHYDQDHLGKIVLPIGGIGTGTVNLGGRGDLRQWEIMNVPGKQNPGGPNENDLESVSPVFCLYTKTADGKTITKSLTGPLEYYEYEHMMGEPVEHHGLPRFRHASFDAAYPFGQVNLSDPDVPVDVKIKAFNPLIPVDADLSGIPIAVFHFVLKNKTDQLVTASVCGIMDNFIGIDGTKEFTEWKGQQQLKGANKNRNQFRTDGDLKGIYMTSDGVDRNDPAWGTIALATDSKEHISYKTSTSPFGWGSEILSFWDDFSDDGQLTNTAYDQPDMPTGALASELEIAPKSTREITFYITWNFPNRFAWSPVNVGNYYSTKYKDAWDVIHQVHPVIDTLERKTLSFVQAFVGSDLPQEVKEAALFNISTLRSQTVFRTADGTMFGWEGVMDRVGSCFGSCTHVWNYEQATAFLFGDLAKTMRAVEFGVSTDSLGLMSFRTNLPVTGPRWNHAAADGQMGTIMKMYREWQLSGDDAFLKKYWPAVKRALAFCWIKNGWDADADGVMEGCQHNTMDVDYYGPNPQMEIWYLGALRAGAEMADYLGDKSFAQKCQTLFHNGSVWTDKHLFNGEYYIQQVQPPADVKAIPAGLRNGQPSRDFSNPDFQLGTGCLVDQLVGQFMSNVCGLGYLVDSNHIRTTLKSIMKYNYRQSMFDHFNHLRSFVFDDEAALLMAAYPHDRPTYPFPYYNEVMTGFEYVAAIEMLYEGQTDNGLLCIRNIRDRFDGRKRNPFDEIECGHHYARAMDSWAAILALTGFHYSAVKKEISFGARPGNYFWSNGYAWGTVVVEKLTAGYEVHLKVLRGELKFEHCRIGEFTKDFKKDNHIMEGGERVFTL
ncbi:MAG TPA: GH116 family glycosyl-hydrolase [Puia sp.]|nr:GH116 family glycosyl-hydrolase [Puia sp.]